MTLLISINTWRMIRTKRAIGFKIDFKNLNE
jgi:hypothetical protein